MSKMSRNKGKRGEREVRDLLRKHGFEAIRGRQYSGSPDSPDVISNFPFHIEAKRVERLNLWQAIEQAATDAGEKRPCVFFKRNHGEWHVAFEANHILELLSDRKAVQ